MPHAGCWSHFTNRLRARFERTHATSEENYDPGAFTSQVHFSLLIPLTKSRTDFLQIRLSASHPQQLVSQCDEPSSFAKTCICCDQQLRQFNRLRKWKRRLARSQPVNNIV